MISRVIISLQVLRGSMVTAARLDNQVGSTTWALRHINTPSHPILVSIRRLEGWKLLQKYCGDNIQQWQKQIRYSKLPWHVTMPSRKLHHVHD